MITDLHLELYELISVLLGSQRSLIIIDFDIPMSFSITRIAISYEPILHYWNDPFYISQNHLIFDVFRGCRKRPAKWNRLICRQLPCIKLMKDSSDWLVMGNTVKPLYSGHLRSLKKVSAIRRYPLYRVLELFEEKIIIEKNLTLFYVVIANNFIS